MITIVDYGMGNIRSIQTKLKILKHESFVTNDPLDIRNKASHIILPGVGNFGEGMRNLHSMNLVDALQERVKQGIPLLGICLGMQLLGDHSEEGDAMGLGLIKGKTKRFQFQGELSRTRIPHVGWNSINIREESPLFQGIPLNHRYYFTHSYHFYAENPQSVLAKAFYGYEFAAVISRNNVFGTQFHPEKSHILGLKVLDNFIRYIQ